MPVRRIVPAKDPGVVHASVAVEENSSSNFASLDVEVGVVAAPVCEESSSFKFLPLDNFQVPVQLVEESSNVGFKRGAEAESEGISIIKFNLCV